MTSKCGKNKKVANKPSDECVTFLLRYFVPLWRLSDEKRRGGQARSFTRDVDYKSGMGGKECEWLLGSSLKHSFNVFSCLKLETKFTCRQAAILVRVYSANKTTPLAVINKKKISPQLPACNLHKPGTMLLRTRKGYRYYEMWLLNKSCYQHRMRIKKKLSLIN